MFYYCNYIFKGKDCVKQTMLNFSFGNKACRFLTSSLRCKHACAKVARPFGLMAIISRDRRLFATKLTRTRGHACILLYCKQQSILTCVLSFKIKYARGHGTLKEYRTRSFKGTIVLLFLHPPRRPVSQHVLTR